MGIRIKDKYYKDKYLYLINKTFNKVISLLDNYGFLGNENVTLNIDHLDYDDLDIEIVFNNRDYGEMSLLGDNELSSFTALDSTRYRITLFIKRIQSINSFENEFQIALARELFKVFVYRSCSLDTLQLSIESKALNYMSSIFVCLYGVFIGDKERVLGVCEDICHAAIRNEDILNV